jgi:hypothetical protein
LKTFLAFIISFLCCMTITLADDNGGYAGDFLRTGLGARSLAMGNTGVAGPVTAYANYYNPALLSQLSDRKVGLSYRFMSLDRRFGTISFSMKVPPSAGFTVNWIESGINNIKSYNSIGEETGDIHNAQNAIYFSFGRSITRKFSIGVSAKLLLAYINDGTDEFDWKGSGFGFDLGLVYYHSQDLAFGYQLRDINAKYKANTTDIFEHGGTTIDAFPVIQRLGTFYHTPVRWLRSAYEFEWSTKDDNGRHHLGLEALYGKNLALRTGYNGQTLTFGAGMDFSFLGTESFLDYVFLPSVIDEGSSHVFSWQVSF